MDVVSELSVWRWLLAFVPILVLLITIIGLRWSAPKAGLAALLSAALLGWQAWGADGYFLWIASAKGLSLSLFVLLIIWAALLLYNLMERLGAISVITHYIAELSRDRLGQALLLGWAFSAVIQGISGFGVPVAVVAPILLGLGFSPITAAAAVLVGHSWAVTFGSMGSSFYTIQLVTGIPAGELGPTMALLFALPILATGFGVAHIVEGWSGIKRGAPTILIAGSVMAFTVWLMVYLGAAQIASVVPGLAGCVVIWLRYRIFQSKSRPPMSTTPKSKLADSLPGFQLAFLPYLLLISIAIVTQLPSIKQATSQLHWGFSYPEIATSLGVVVAPVQGYAKIGLLSHPAPIILATIMLTVLIFGLAGRWRKELPLSVLGKTLKQCVQATLGIATMVMMALIMNDTGMTHVLASGLARVTGILFPIVSPLIGALGCFMTGSNTNSNVMFGALQVETAKSLGLSTVVIASIQSIGGSLGSAIAPAKALIGSTLVGLAGREGEIMRKALPYCLICLLLVGLEAWIADFF